jgi:hypothetical protein
MKKVSIFLSVCALLASNVYAAEWWEEAKTLAVEAAEDQINEKKDELLGKATDELIDIKSDGGSLIATNWTNQYIEVTAIGTAGMDVAHNLAHALSLSEAAARVIAQRKLAEEIYGTRVTSNMILKDELIRNSTTMTQVDALIKGAKEIEVKHEELSDGSVLCTMSMGMLLTTEDGLIQVTGSIHGEEANLISDIYTPTATITELNPDDYSGIIIDARGLDIVPALMPNILSEDGRIVYGAPTMDGNNVTNYGITSYAASIEEARRQAGGDPFIIKALKTVGNVAADLVLPGDLADDLFHINEAKDMSGKVVILTR